MSTTFGIYFPGEMVDYVYRRFPQLVGAIQALKERAAAFREVCADYEEMCAWLAAQDDRSAAPPPSEWALAQELKRQLEDEIHEMLEEYDELTS